MASFSLSEISIYPVKSTAGQALDQCSVEKRGLRGDRRWMVVDPGGRFLTGRQLPRLTLIKAVERQQTLVLSANGIEALQIAIPSRGSAENGVVIWKDRLLASDAGEEAAQWLSRFLEQDCRLVYMGESHQRTVDPEYSRPGDLVSFADGFPLLLISEASLGDLNRRLQRPVSMAHFRPNLVVKGSQAYAEDQWNRLRIGAIEFDMVKPCSRCVFTTVNPESGKKQADGQPLRTLAGYRRASDGGVMFGVNLIARGEGELVLGDPVDVLD